MNIQTLHWEPPFLLNKSFWSKQALGIPIRMKWSLLMLFFQLSARFIFFQEWVVLGCWKWQNILISLKKIICGTRQFWADKGEGGIFKGVWNFLGVGRCLKVTLQTCVENNFFSCYGGKSDPVKAEQTGREDPIVASGNYSCCHEMQLCRLCYWLLKLP